MPTDKSQLNQDEQEINAELENLLKDTEKISQEIEVVNKEAHKRMDVLSSQDTEALEKIEKAYAELDKLEQDTSDELDKLMLQRAEELASE